MRCNFELSMLQIVKVSVERPTLPSLIPYRRIAVVAIGLAILIARSPQSFLAPEFYAEDGVLFQDAYNDGFHSLIAPLMGSLHFYGYVVAKLAVMTPLTAVPRIQAYGGLAAFAITMWIVTSPRFQAPYRPLLALALACAPAAFEIIGVLINSDWVLPIGVFALLFSDPADEKRTLYAEMAFVFVAGLSGPTGIFLLPLFVWQSAVAHGEARRRLVILSAVLAITSAVQLALLVQATSFVMAHVQPAPYSKLLWASMPIRWLDAIWPFHLKWIGFGWRAITIVASVAVAAICFSLVPSRRDLKVAMIFFATVVLVTGMLKYRADLGTVAEACGRYFYAGSVFFFWFLCLAAERFSRFGNVFLLACCLSMAKGAAVYLVNRPVSPVPFSSYLSQRGYVLIVIAPDRWEIMIKR